MMVKITEPPTGTPYHVHLDIHCRKRNLHYHRMKDMIKNSPTGRIVIDKTIYQCMHTKQQPVMSSNVPDDMLETWQCLDCDTIL